MQAGKSKASVCGINTTHPTLLRQSRITPISSGNRVRACPSIHESPSSILVAQFTDEAGRRAEESPGDIIGRTTLFF